MPCACLRLSSKYASTPCVGVHAAHARVTHHLHPVRPSLARCPVGLTTSARGATTLADCKRAPDDTSPEWGSYPYLEAECGPQSVNKTCQRSYPDGSLPCCAQEGFCFRAGSEACGSGCMRDYGTCTPSPSIDPAVTPPVVLDPPEGPMADYTIYSRQWMGGVQCHTLHMQKQL